MRSVRPPSRSRPSLRQAGERHQLSLLPEAVTILTIWGLSERRQSRLLRMRRSTLQRAMAAGYAPFRPRLTALHDQRISLIIQVYVTLMLTGGQEHAERWPRDDPTFLGLTPIDYVDRYATEAFFLACRSVPGSRP